MQGHNTFLILFIALTRFIFAWGNPLPSPMPQSAFADAWDTFSSGVAAVGSSIQRQARAGITYVVNERAKNAAAIAARPPGPPPTGLRGFLSSWYSITGDLAHSQPPGRCPRLWTCR